MQPLRKSLPKETLFWSAGLIVLLIIISIFSAILLPFVFGLIVAYFLNPLINYFSQFGISRAISSSFILLTFFIVLALLLLILIPILLTQLGQFIANFSYYAEKLDVLLSETDSIWLEQNTSFGRFLIQDNINNLLQQSGNFLSSILSSLWSSSKVFINIVSFFVIAPVIAFYLMVDWPRMVKIIDSWIPRNHLYTVRNLFYEMDKTVAGFIRGQSVVSLIIALYYIVMLGFLGLNFSFLIGIIIGILSFIPYVGTLIGLVLSIGMSFMQFWPDDWSKIVIALIIFFVGQFIEGYILQPKLVGSSVGLHPVWLMFSLIAFSYLFGFTGTLIAVPVAAVIGVLIRFILKIYLNSSFYDEKETK
ncbi:AI-2E family transporter [Bartonella sp. DGB1]|uniref:AI-2E family transporter n=1 Tax=Bartonella sp. DGB1 TaxID=3239807 RepID=UPI003526B45E